MLSGYSNKDDKSDDNAFKGIPGATIGGGDFDACVAAVKMALLPEAECATQPCVVGGVSQPYLSEVRRSLHPHSLLAFHAMLLQIPQKLLVFENFFFVLEGLGKQPLPADVTIGDYKALGSQYCKLSMPLAPGSPASLLPDAERYCFGSAFASPSSPFHFPPLTHEISVTFTPC
jgi:hypothetical protein